MRTSNNEECVKNSVPLLLIKGKINGVVILCEVDRKKSSIEFPDDFIIISKYVDFLK